MPIPLLRLHYRNFNTTTDRSVPYASPNHWRRFPLSIWPDSIEFTCSSKWPVRCFPILGTGSASLTPDVVWPVSSGLLPHLVIGINVTTYFSHHNLPYRSFITGSISFSSTVLTYRDQRPRFFLSRSPHQRFHSMQRKVV